MVVRENGGWLGGWLHVELLGACSCDVDMAQLVCCSTDRILPPATGPGGVDSLDRDRERERGVCGVCCSGCSREHVGAATDNVGAGKLGAPCGPARVQGGAPGPPEASGAALSAGAAAAPHKDEWFV